MPNRWQAISRTIVENSLMHMCVTRSQAVTQHNQNYGFSRKKLWGLNETLIWLSSVVTMITQTCSLLCFIPNDRLACAGISYPLPWASVHWLVQCTLECHWLTQCTLAYHWATQRILAGYTGYPAISGGLGQKFWEAPQAQRWEWSYHLIWAAAAPSPSSIHSRSARTHFSGKPPEPHSTSQPQFWIGW